MKHQLALTHSPKKQQFLHQGIIIRLIIGILVTILMLSSCSGSSGPNSGSHWQTYQNQRFRFEFPYPNHWTVAQSPANLDGQAFTDPQKPTVEIRGWANYQLSPNQNSPKVPPNPQNNFITEQGLGGVMKVEIGKEVSTIALTLEQGNIQYHWRGQSPSEDFADYYKFFHYVASKYKIN